MTFSNSLLNVLKSDDALTTSGKLFQILGAWYRQELSPKRVVLSLGTFKMSFPLKAYVVSRNEINSFKFSAFLLFTSLIKNRAENFTKFLLHQGSSIKKI